MLGHNLHICWLISLPSTIYHEQIALLGRSSKTTKVGEICTRGSNIVVAKTSDCIDTCMRKMLAKVRSRMEVDRLGLGLVGCLGVVRFVSLVSCFGGLGCFVC